LAISDEIVSMLPANPWPRRPQPPLRAAA